MMKVKFNKSVVKKMSINEFKSAFDHFKDHVNLNEEYDKINPTKTEVVETLPPPRFKSEGKTEKSK